jgi:holliday junction DNA helicase RuvA
MIARLQGRLIEKHPTRVIVDVGGVGYDVSVPLLAFAAMGEAGSELTLRVHTHVREDAIQLFGFPTARELGVFERLIGVSGIGPRLALAVLSGIAVEELTDAIVQADVARLTSIPGVGKKTAERIVLELKDKIGPAAHEAPGRAAGPRDDLVSALLNLGYHRPAAEKAADQALRSAPDVGFEDALRQALRTLTR